MHLNGVLLIDKPREVTSHDVVLKIRRLLRQKRVGHTGTLDPMATGLLVLCLGKATSLSDFFIGLTKEYLGEILLGRESDTYDSEGEVHVIEEHPVVSLERVRAIFAELEGEQEQTPPPFSAIKVKGKKLYEYARRGEKVEVPSRRVVIYEITVKAFHKDRIEFSARVSSGTYIRSIAHEVGRRLRCGALLSSLRRTRIGNFHVNDAVRIDTDSFSEASIQNNLRSPFDACESFPRVVVDTEGVNNLSNGRSVESGSILHIIGTIEEGESVPVFSPQKTLLAIATAKNVFGRNLVLHPRRVLIDPSDLKGGG